MHSTQCKVITQWFSGMVFVEHNYGAGCGLWSDKDKKKIYASMEAVHPNTTIFGMALHLNHILYICICSKYTLNIYFAEKEGRKDDAKKKKRSVDNCTSCCLHCKRKNFWGLKYFVGSIFVGGGEFLWFKAPTKIYFPQNLWCFNFRGWTPTKISMCMVEHIHNTLLFYINMYITNIYVCIVVWILFWAESLKISGIILKSLFNTIYYLWLLNNRK